MKTWCSVVSLMLFAVPCAAAGYDHYGIAMSAKNRGDMDLAISEFTAALNAGDLNSELVPVAHLQRGIAYALTHDCAKAAADAASALQLKPGYREALTLEAGANVCAGNYAPAILAYQALTASYPSADLFREEAIAYWMNGDFAGAEQPLVQAISIQPDNAYSSLWLAVMHARAGDVTKAVSTKYDEEEWPGPLLALYAGKVGPDAVMAAAAKGDKAANQTCEANFYVAEWWLAQKNAANAWHLLAQAAAICPRTFYEYRLSAFELTHPRRGGP